MPEDPTERPTAMIVSQHGDGIGHLSRCSAIAAELHRFLDVTIFSGGRPVRGFRAPPGVGFVQLPPTTFSGVERTRPASLDGSDIESTDRARAAILLRAYRRLRPAAILFEYYPVQPWRFGRTLDPLFDRLAREQAPPRCFCLLRPYPKTVDDTDPGELAVTRDRLARHFTAVFHHVDPRAFDESVLHPATRTALEGARVIRTGQVRRRAPDAPAEPYDFVVCAGAGGAQGMRLLHAVADALPPGQDGRALLVCGPFVDPAEVAALRAAAGPKGIAVTHCLPALDGVFRSARRVLCLGGANTLVEALDAGAAVMAFPKPTAEQAVMVSRLAAKGLVLPGRLDMDARELASAMERLGRFRPAFRLDCDGAARTAAHVRRSLGGPSARMARDPAAEDGAPIRIRT